MKKLYEILIPLWPIQKGKSRWLNLVTRVLNIQPYGYLKPKPVGSYHLHLDPADPNDRLFYFDFLGEGYRQVLAKILRKGDNVIDVGVNVGHFSAVCAQYVGLQGKVYGLEANPNLVKRLRIMTSQVPDGPIQIYHHAVWHTSGKIDFHVAADASGWSSLIENPTFTTAYSIEVQALTLDDFVAQHQIAKIRLLKLDIEGAETDALLGAKNLLQSGQLDYILVEIGDPQRLTAFNHTGEELGNLLESQNYLPLATVGINKISPIPKGRTRTPSTRIPTMGDYLYVRKPLYRKAMEIFS